MTIVSERLRHDLADPISAIPGSPQILHIATRYLRGGSERRIVDITRAIPEADHHLVIGRDADPDAATREVTPTSLEVVPSLIRAPHPLRDVAAVIQLRRILGRRPYDLVITHQAKAGILGRAAARMTSVPAAHSLSMASFGEGYPSWQSRVFRFLESRFAETTTAFLVVGEDLAKRYEAIGVPASKLHVIRSGVRLDAVNRDACRRTVRDRLGILPDRPLIVYVGSLDARKNVLELPRLLGLLLQDGAGPRPFLLVAGDGPLAPRLRAAIEASALGGDAALIGHVGDPLPIIAAADLIVLLSRAEGLPQVLVQAASVGTPFVSYAVDGVRELLRFGAAGVAVKPPRVERAAAATARVLDGHRPRPEGIDLPAWAPDAIAHSYRSALGPVLARSTIASHSGGRPS